MMRSKTFTYLQYGCGFCAPATWQNFDASPTLRFERLPLVGRLYTRNSMRFPTNVLYGDITKGLPVDSNSYSGVYASHVLEHLSLKDFQKALIETYRVLKPRGIFRLVVPDLYQIAYKYVQGVKDGVSESSIMFMNESHLGRKERPYGLIGKISELFGNSQHLWMWDELSLKLALEKVGFQNIRRAHFGDCIDERFLEVEEQGRFYEACAVEAVKP